ncbi:MAG: hypothetical protein R3C11_15510 [Planctomycetaceae bacterium]
MGIVSNYLHDVVQVGDEIEIGPPCGEFILNPSKYNGKPVVLLAGGIGVTPLLAMAQSLCVVHPSASLYFIYSARNSSVIALESEIKELAVNNPHMHVRILFDQPLDKDITEQKCDAVGVLSNELLQEWVPVNEADFYFCGPQQFMENLISIFNQLGIPESRTHYEFFGPKQELISV